jgi:hypothetical protein
MEVIDEKGRVFGVVNVVDLLVVVFLLAVVAAGAALVMGGGGAKGAATNQTESVTLTVQATDVQPYVAQAVPESGTVDPGNVTSVENKMVRPATIITENNSGGALARDHPRLKTVELDVIVMADRRNGTPYFDGRRLYVGSEIRLDFGNVVLSGDVTAVETGE